MLLIQVRFQCDECPNHVDRLVRVGPSLQVGADQYPVDWSVVDVDAHGVRIRCPLHVPSVK